MYKYIVSSIWGVSKVGRVVMYVLPCIKDLDSATLLFLLTLDKPPVNTKYKIWQTNNYYTKYPAKLSAYNK
jgi:hypothetical protein